MPSPPLSPPVGVRLMLTYFTLLEDPRVDRTKRHELSHLIVMALCGTLCGADGWDDLEDYASANVEWFRGFLDLPNGTPSADTFRRVFSALEPVAFERQFRIWVRAFADSLEGEVVAIDGKTLRGTVDAATKQTSLHLLHVWATEQQLLLAHVAVDGAGAEAPGIPELLRLVDIKGAVITTDAAGCTAPVTQAVRDGGAEYVLTLKANRRALHAHVTALFDAAEARRYRGVATHRSVDRDMAARRLEPSEYFRSASCHWQPRSSGAISTPLRRSNEHAPSTARLRPNDTFTSRACPSIPSVSPTRSALTGASRTSSTGASTSASPRTSAASATYGRQATSPPSRATRS